MLLEHFLCVEESDCSCGEWRPPRRICDRGDTILIRFVRVSHALVRAPSYPREPQESVTNSIQVKV